MVQGVSPQRSTAAQSIKEQMLQSVGRAHRLINSPEVKAHPLNLLSPLRQARPITIQRFLVQGDGYLLTSFTVHQVEIAGHWRIELLRGKQVKDYELVVV